MVEGRHSPSRDGDSPPSAAWFPLLASLLLLLGAVGIVSSSTHVPGRVFVVNSDPTVSGRPGAVKPLSVKVIASPAMVDVGQTTNITALTAGGIAPYNYSWAGLPTGCSGTNRSSLECTPTVAGDFDVSVTVYDSASHTAVNSTVVSVSNSSPFQLIFSTLGPYLVAIAAGALGGFIIIVALVLRRRQRRKKAPLVPYTDSAYVPPHPPPEL